MRKRRTIRRALPEPSWRELNSGTFGRKPPPRRPSRVSAALLALGLAAVGVAVGLTFFDVKPAAPFLVGLGGFGLILTAILSVDSA